MWVLSLMTHMTTCTKYLLEAMHCGKTIVSSLNLSSQDTGVLERIGNQNIQQDLFADIVTLQ